MVMDQHLVDLGTTFIPKLHPNHKFYLKSEGNDNTDVEAPNHKRA